MFDPFDPTNSPFHKTAERVMAIFKEYILEDGEMNVCDLCRETPLEKEKVEVSFRAMYNPYMDTKSFSIASEDTEFAKLTCDKEICEECCKNLLVLFNKKGGESK